MRENAREKVGTYVMRREKMREWNEYTTFFYVLELLFFVAAELFRIILKFEWKTPQNKYSNWNNDKAAFIEITALSQKHRKDGKKLVISPRNGIIDYFTLLKCWTQFILTTQNMSTENFNPLAKYVCVSFELRTTNSNVRMDAQLTLSIKQLLLLDFFMI